MEDQENEQQNQEQSVGQQVAEQGKQMAEQAVKDTAEQVAKKAGKAVGSGVKKLLHKALIAAAPYIFAAIVAVVSMLMIYVIIDKVREIASTILTSISTFVIVGDNGPIAPSQSEMLDSINKQLEEAGIDKTDLYLGNRLQADLYLYKFMSASLATQLPYIKDSPAKTMTEIAATALIPGAGTVEFIKDTFGEEVQGIVKIKRQTGDTKSDLTYKKHDDLVKLIEENDTSALKYFSIDENWMLCIAKSNKTTTTNPDGTSTVKNTVEEEKIPYQTLISKYSVPFEFFITLQQMTQNAEYVSAVADLIKDGEIELTIFDSTQVVTTEYTYTYIVKTKWQEYVPKQAYINTRQYAQVFTRANIARVVTSTTESGGETSSSSESSSGKAPSKGNNNNSNKNPNKGSNTGTSSNSGSNSNTGTSTTPNKGHNSSADKNDGGSVTPNKGNNSNADKNEENDTPDKGHNNNENKNEENDIPDKGHNNNADKNEENDTPDNGNNSNTEKDEEQEGNNTPNESNESQEPEMEWQTKTSEGEEQHETTTTVSEINSITVDITKANVWVIDVEKSYTNSNTEEYPLGEDGITTELKDEDEPTLDSRDDVETWEIKRSETTKETVQNVGWEVATSNIDIDADKFLGLWKNNWLGDYVPGASYAPNGFLVKYKIPNTLFKSESPVSNILSSEELLYDQLEKSENTQTHAQLMRYLIAYYKDPDKAVKPDLSIFDTTSFNGVSTIEGGTIQEKVWNALINAGFSEYAAAGAMGNIHYESGGFDPYKVEGGYNENTGGIGICQWTNSNRGTEGRNTNLKNYAKSKGTTWQDEDIQVQYLLTELTGEGDAVGYASYQLMTTTNDRYGRIWYRDEWKNAQDIETATRAFCYTFERPSTSASSKSIATRIDLAQRYYNTYHGRSGDYTGDVVRYYQNDYASVKYGSSNIANCGCGPTSFAMVATHLTGTTITPQDAISWCGNIYYVKDQGTSWSYFKAATRHFEIGCTVQQTNDFTKVEQALKNGKLVISSQGKGLFTSGGHYILLTKMENNLIYVNDPNKNNAVNKGYNNRGFTPQEINRSARQYWIFE